MSNEKTLNLIDEKEVARQCKQIDALAKGDARLEDCLAILDEFDRRFGYLTSEKTRNLRRLLNRTSIKDLSKWRIEIFRNTAAIRNLVHAKNNGTRLLAEEASGL